MNTKSDVWDESSPTLGLLAFLVLFVDSEHVAGKSSLLIVTPIGSVISSVGSAAACIVIIKR